MRILLVIMAFVASTVRAADLPDPGKIQPVKLVDVPHYSEGVVFGHAGRGYLSEDKTIWQFDLAGKAHEFAVTGAPNGHKILADGSHFVCDASQHAVLHLSPEGKPLKPASIECDGKPLRGPNDLTLDTPNRGFYFTDPGGSDEKNLIGTVHYVDAHGKTSLAAQELAFPNGIILAPDGKKLYVGESKKNRVLVYEVLAPGKLGQQKVLADLPRIDPLAAVKQIDNQPDGMCLDAAGNLYVAHYGMHQVQVLNPAGKLLATYEAGVVTTSNVAFGGPKLDQLFVTGALANEQSTGAVFRLDLGVQGLMILPPAAP